MPPNSTKHVHFVAFASYKIVRCRFYSELSMVFPCFSAGCGNKIPVVVALAWVCVCAPCFWLMAHAALRRSLGGVGAFAPNERQMSALRPRSNEERLIYIQLDAVGLYGGGKSLPPYRPPACMRLLARFLRLHLALGSVAAPYKPASQPQQGAWRVFT